MEMELGPLPASAESGHTPTRTGPQPYHLVQREFPVQNATTRQEKTPKGSRFRRTPTRITRDGDRIQGVGKSAATTMTPGSARPRTTGQLKPLLPVSERRSQEDNTPGKKNKKGSQDDEKETWDIAPDGGSAGREGRQFAVWNVGNNGRIYLRYVCVGL